MSEKRDEIEKVVNEIYCDLDLDGQEDWDRVSEILYQAFPEPKPAPVQSADEFASLTPEAEALIIAMGNYGGASFLRPCADKLAERIKWYGAAQRQAGREEVDDILLQEIESLKEKLKIAAEVIKSYDPAYDTADFLHRVGSVDFAQWVEEDIENKTNKRYAALVEAAREAKDALQGRFGICALVIKLIEALAKVDDKALSDLGEARKV